MDDSRLRVIGVSLPGRYASALLSEGVKSKCLDRIFEDFDKLSEFFGVSRNVVRILSHRFSVKGSREMLQQISSCLSFCNVFSAFFEQLVANNRVSILNKIRHAFEAAFLNYKNKREVTVYSFCELSAEQKKAVSGVVSKMFTEKSIISYEVDSTLLGGLKVLSEGKVFDSSVLGQVTELSKYLKKLDVFAGGDLGYEN
jgi:F-type H+-transporting ATPase subunit delta